MRWWNKRHGAERSSGGWLARLARDRAGNTLALMAAAMIPMAALTGSAVDMARLYVVKVRLQQACDAGALAGRKFMSDSNSSNLDDNAITQARTFFANNFSSGYMGTPVFTKDTNPYPFTPSKTSDNQVAGTASVAVPMTVMKMFSVAAQTIKVDCQARYDVADTDVIFVLDTTGSMACLPQDSDSTCTSYVNAAGNNSYTRPSDSSAVAGYSGTTGYSVPEKSGSRIEALRQAVVGFFDTFANNADPSTHVRYGFVTYTSAVNMGGALKSLNPDYLVGGGGGNGTAPYQSRQVTADYTASSTSQTVSVAQNACNGSTRTPSAALTYTNTSSATKVTYSWNTANGGSCTRTTDTLGPQYTYNSYNLNVTQLVAGNAVVNPSKVDGSTTQWAGCVEERVDPSSAGQSSFSVNNLPADINPDLVPTNDATRWRPLWSDVEYGRSYNGYWTPNSMATNGENGTFWWYGDVARQKAGNTVCGKPARRLATMGRSDVYNYVYANDFVPIGGTYHDTGMIWGTRLLSPTGLFKNDTDAWAGRNAPNRVIVFLTDGDMSPSLMSYSMYGVESMDRRVTGGTGQYGNLTSLHNARFLAACSAAKARNISVWTVEIDTAASATMKSCASTSSQALFSTTGTGLSDVFKSIAQQVARLRISQ